MHADEADAQLVVATLGWLDGFVISQNLCPFAMGVRKQTRCLVCRGDAYEAASVVSLELASLRAVDPVEPATTLLILPSFADFADLIEFQGEMEVLAAADDTALPIQLLAFHPDATFSDNPADAADFSMRSPYPMLHLLRDSDVVEAEEQWASQHAPAEPPSIQDRNAAFLRGLGYDAVAQASAWARSVGT
jgi:hypothetical protein